MQVSVPQPPLNGTVGCAAHVDQDFAQVMDTLSLGHSFFTVFDVYFDARVFVRSDAASIWDLVHIATQSYPDVSQGLSYRLLRYVLPGWPEPQLVVWHGLQADEVVVPVQCPTPLGVCTVQMQRSASAFAVAVEVCHRCHLGHSVFQSVARQETSLLVNWQTQDPFTDHCLFDADSAAISGMPALARPLGRSRGHPLLRTLQVHPRSSFTHADPCHDIVVHAPCRHSQRLEVPPQCRPFQVMRLASAAIGHTTASRLLFLENSPLCFGTPPHAILVDSHDLPEGHRWALFDLRRLCVPPYPQYFVLPVPSIVDLPWVRCVFKQNFPRLPHSFAAYLDEVLLDRPCAVQASAPLITVVSLLTGSHVAAAHALPTLLDTCSELVQRPGYQALFMAASPSWAAQAPAVTTSTTTGMQVEAEAEVPAGALVDPITDIQHSPIEVFVASAMTRFVSCTVTGNVVLEDFLSFITVQLGSVQETFNADRYGMVPRVFFGPTGNPVLFFTATNANSPNAVWVDARPFLPQPIVFVAYAPVLITHICDILRRPDLRSQHWAWNGAVWQHQLIRLSRGDVITVRPHPSALFNAPLNLLRLRVIGVQALLFELTGPCIPTEHPAHLPVQFSTEQIRQHWAAVCAAMVPLFGDFPAYSKVLLIGYGIPPIRCSARTRIAPTERQLQDAYDMYLAPIFGQRQWIDTGEIDGEHCIFVDADSQAHRQRPWLVTMGFAHDAFSTDDQGDGLRHTPAPYGMRLRPVWFSSHFGRATFCPVATADSPLHRSEHTCPVEVIYARPDLLQRAATSTLAEFEDEAIANAAVLQAELSEIDCWLAGGVPPQDASSSSASSADASSGVSSGGHPLAAADSDDTGLMQTGVFPAASLAVTTSSTTAPTHAGLSNIHTLCHPYLDSSTGGTPDPSSSSSTPQAIPVLITNPATVDFTKGRADAVRLAASDREQSFTLFDPYLQTRLVRRRSEWTDADCQRIAASLFAHLGPRPVVKRLTIEIVGLPRPQFAATAGQQSATSRTHIADCRALNHGICVVDAPLAATPYTIATAVVQTCAFQGLPWMVASRKAQFFVHSLALAPFEPVPEHVDSTCFYNVPAPAQHPSSSDRTWQPQVEEHFEEVLDLIEHTFLHGDTFLTMAHVPGSAPMAIESSRLWDADALAAAVAASLGMPVHIHWPGLFPRGTDALLHIVVEPPEGITADQTLLLIDAADLQPSGPRFAARVTGNSLTLGELFCIVREAFPEAAYPSEIQVNGRVLEFTGARRYYCPTIRPVTRATAIRRPGVQTSVGIRPHLVIERIPPLALELQQARRDYPGHSSSSGFSEELAGTSLLQTRLSRKSAPTRSLLPVADAVELQVWRLSQPMHCFNLSGQEDFATVESLICAVYPDFRRHMLVPVFPQQSGTLRCLIVPQRGAADAHTVLLVRAATGNSIAARVPYNADAEAVRTLHDLPKGTFTVDGHPWRGTIQGCYDGLVLHFHSEPPSHRAVRALPTPCRQRTPLGCAAVGETTPRTENFGSQSGSRDSSLIDAGSDQAPTAPACIAAPDTDGNSLYNAAPATLVLDEAIPVHMARPHCVGVCADMLHHCTDGFGLLDLRQQLPAHEDIPPICSNLVLSVPPWPRTQASPFLMFYTDGSFCHRRSASSWAIAVFASQDAVRWSWAGFTAGAVECQGTYGAPSAFEAELYALAATFLVILRARPEKATCIFDSQSAAAVACCTANTADSHPLAAAVRSLFLTCQVVGVDMRFMHTYSHQGNPGNELVDSLATLCHSCSDLAQCSSRLPEVLSWPELHWVWMTTERGLNLPPLRDGVSPALHVAIPARSELSTPASLAGGLPLDAPSVHRLQLCLATYNTLSLRSHLQQHSLAALFKEQGCHVVGLQETRLSVDGVATYGPYTAFCAPANAGQEGVQLWVNFSLPASPAGCESPLFFSRPSFCIRHAEPRLLLVTGCLGDIRILFVVAHALTSTHAEAELAQWWTHVDQAIRRIPRGFCPVFLMDANARFSPVKHDSSASAAEACNSNAQHLQSLSRSHAVHLSALRDNEGNDIVSWVSPNGNRACLDFLGLPDAWGCCMVTYPAPAHFNDQFAGIDHSPVLVRMRLTVNTRVEKRARMPQARALRTLEGQAALRHAWLHMPQVPWHVDVDTHLGVINRHLQDCLANAFAREPRVSHPAISPASWQLLRTQRGLRRVMFRRRQHWDREVMATFLQAWRRGLSDQQHSTFCRRGHFQRLQAARCGVALRACRRALRRQSRQDHADFTRHMFETARSREDLPHLLRSVLRTGRRYKPPQLLPDIVDASGHVCETRADFLAHAGRHFARAERACASALASLPTVYGGHRAGVPLAVYELPSLEELTRAFGRLKAGRAPGLTGLLPEVYRACPDLAAITHFPLALKAVSSGTYPLLWMGGIATPIPKPAKSPAAMSGWRSILLQECSGKAVAAALRSKLLAGLERIAPAGMAGGRRGIPLAVPCHLVGRYLDTLRQTVQSGAVLFVDGESAFYATVRCFLDPDHGDMTLDHWVSSLHDDPYITDQLRALLRAGDVMLAGNIAASVCDALRCSLSSTWYTALPTHDEIYRSVTGTVPGAPLADLLFQLTFAMCMDQVTQALSEAGHCARLPPSTSYEVPCSHPTWMDDVALLLRASRCEEVAPALASAAGIMRGMLCTTGISMNLLPGKTEGLVMLHGAGSRAERHRLFVELNGELPFGGSRPDSLCLTDSYVHLGVMLGTQCLAKRHIERRARLAELSYGPLRRRLLFNPCLRQGEKRELLRAFAISRLTHGLEQWTLDVDKDYRAFHTAYMSLLRRSIRPILNCSSSCLRDIEVCSMLEMVTPKEAHQIALARSLAQVCSSQMPFLHHLLHTQATWLRHGVEAASCLLAIVQASPLPSVPALACDMTSWTACVATRLGNVSQLLKRCCRRLIRGRHALALRTAANARSRGDLQKAGVVLAHIPDEAPVLLDPIVCSVCHRRFASVAAEAAHARKLHGRVALHTQALRGTACLVCRKEYWSASRLREHLRFSVACCHAYIGADLGTPLPHEVGCVGPSSRPVTTLIGPQPWWCSLRPHGAVAVNTMLPPTSWLEQEIYRVMEDLGGPQPSNYGPALRAAIRLFHMAPRDLAACLDEAVFSPIHSLWHSIFVAASHVLSTECRETTRPCSAGHIQRVGRWLLLCPDGPVADVTCLKDGD